MIPSPKTVTTMATTTKVAAKSFSFRNHFLKKNLGKQRFVTTCWLSYIFAKLKKFIDCFRSKKTWVQSEKSKKRAWFLFHKAANSSIKSIWALLRKFSAKKTLRVDSGYCCCGSAGWSVASSTRDPQLESHHFKFFSEKWFICQLQRRAKKVKIVLESFLWACAKCC